MLQCSVRLFLSVCEHLKIPSVRNDNASHPLGTAGVKRVAARPFWAQHGHENDFSIAHFGHPVSTTEHTERPTAATEHTEVLGMQRAEVGKGIVPIPLPRFRHDSVNRLRRSATVRTFRAEAAQALRAPRRRRSFARRGGAGWGSTSGSAWVGLLGRPAPSRQRTVEEVAVSRRTVSIRSGGRPASCASAAA